MNNRLLFFTIATLIVGILIGAGFGILNAPRAGQATRAVLQARSVQFREKLALDIHMASIQDQGKITKDVHTASTQLQSWFSMLLKQAHTLLAKIGSQLKFSLGSMKFPNLVKGR